jgi:hypothetical protein
MKSEDLPDPCAHIDALGREVYGDSFEQFLATPRRSLAWETPAALLRRGDCAPVLEILLDAYEGNFG